MVVIASEPRAERFGFVCRRCTRCCYDKRIQVNPYEIARLAHRFGQNTTEFRATATEESAGNYLARAESGACIFLGGDGCQVHDDRPLVCRLYPLGRHVAADGSERFSHLTPHPETESEITDRGTIAEFLAQQGAEPFMRAADAYADWVRRAVGVLGSAAESATDPVAAFDLVDMDAAIAAYCGVTGIAEPTDIEDRTNLHLKILDRRIEEIAGGQDE